MEKDKLILKDNTVVELEAGASLNNVGVVFANRESMLSTWDKFTEDNLKAVQIKNGDGLTVGNYTDLVLESETSVVQKDGSVHTSFHLREKSDIEKRLDAVEEGQEVQDGAIMEMAEVVSGMAES